MNTALITPSLLWGFAVVAVVVLAAAGIGWAPWPLLLGLFGVVLAVTSRDDD